MTNVTIPQIIKKRQIASRLNYVCFRHQIPKVDNEINIIVKLLAIGFLEDTLKYSIEIFPIIMLNQEDRNDVRDILFKFV